jgi:hypothetical protein
VNKSPGREFRPLLGTRAGVASALWIAPSDRAAPQLPIARNPVNEPVGREFRPRLDTRAGLAGALWIASATRSG